MKSIMKDSIILFLITVIAGALLGGVYFITANPIAVQNEKAKQEAYKKVFLDGSGNAMAEEFKSMKFPSVDGTFSTDATTEAFQSNLATAGYEKDEINEIAVAFKNGTRVGLAVTVTAKDGYGGDIKFSVGILEDGTVNGISMLAISETAGLGMKAKEPAFTRLFAGKNVESFKVTKTGAASENEIDALSGATITSKAVTNGVNSALVAAKQVMLTYDTITENGGVVIE